MNNKEIISCSSTKQEKSLVNPELVTTLLSYLKQLKRMEPPKSQTDPKTLHARWSSQMT
jgi:hypothetical protein